MDTPQVHQCEHEGCSSINTVQCCLPGDLDKGDIISWYCTAHCFEEGYCWSCGNFYSGCEDFDFHPSRLCSNCRSELAEPDDEEILGEFFE